MVEIPTLKLFLRRAAFIKSKITFLKFEILFLFGFYTAPQICWRLYFDMWWGWISIGQPPSYNKEPTEPSQW